MNSLFLFIFYLILFLNTYCLFVMVSGRKNRWYEILIFALVNMALSFWMDHYSLTLDSLYLLPFSYLTKREQPLTYHIFYSFYTFTNQDLFSRLIGYLILPTLLNTSIDHMNNSALLILLTYALVIPFHLFFKSILHIDYRNFQEPAAGGSQPTKMFKPLNISMVTFFIVLQTFVFCQYNINGFPRYTEQFRYILIAIYVLIFFYGLYRLNQHSLELLTQKMNRERLQQYNNLKQYNNYLESLFTEVNFFKNETNSAMHRFGKILKRGTLRKSKSPTRSFLLMKIILSVIRNMTWIF